MVGVSSEVTQTALFVVESIALRKRRAFDFRFRNHLRSSTETIPLIVCFARTIVKLY